MTDGLQLSDLTSADIGFILSTLSSDIASQDAVQRLLNDDESRAELLDDERLAERLLCSPECLGVSPTLYFYLLLRRALPRAGLRSRGIAAYLAGMLAEFRGRQWRQPLADGRKFDYLADIVGAIAEAESATAYRLRVHLGNYALFVAGIFPKHVRHRQQRRGAPGLRYYDGMGRTSFAVAARHGLARRERLDDVFEQLADAYKPARRALNDVAHRLMFIG